MDTFQIISIVILITVGTVVLATALFGIKDEISKGFWWHREWLKQEKKYKSRIYELEEDLRLEKRLHSITKIEHEGLKRKDRRCI